MPTARKSSTSLGSASQDVYKLFVAEQDSMNNLMTPINKEYEAAEQAHDTVKMKKLDSIYTKRDDDMKGIIINFAKTHNSSVAAATSSSGMYGCSSSRSWNPSRRHLIQVLISRCMSRPSKTGSGGILKKVQIGMPAVDFTMNDTAGNPVTLSSLKGKILLLDYSGPPGAIPAVPRTPTW